MGGFLITMNNSENKNCSTLTLDEAYGKFEKNRQARNLSKDSMQEYFNNYKYFSEFLEYLYTRFRCSNNYMRSGLQ